MDNPFNLPVRKEPEVSTTALDRPVSESDKKLGDNIIDFLPQDTKAVLSENQVYSVAKYVKSMQFGITGIAAMICKADQCLFYNRCPLYLNDIPLPVGKSCSVEEGLQQVWLQQFANASGIDLSNTNESAYDMLLLNDLANYQLLETRATMELAETPSIQIRSFAGYDNKGQPMHVIEMNKIVLFKEKMAKMKMKILRELIATRMSKSEEKAHTKDRATAVAEMLEKVKSVRMGRQIVDADFEVKQ